MDSVALVLFSVNVAWMLTHELDAIRRHEWRIFPITRRFDDETGYLVFAAVHIPLFVLILSLLPVRGFQIGFDVFMIVHAGLHWQMRSHPRYEFHSGFSRVLIFGAVPLGLLHLWLLRAVG